MGVSTSPRLLGALGLVLVAVLTLQWHASATTKGSAQLATRRMPDEDDRTGAGPAPPETVALWVKIVASMGPTSSTRSRSARSATGTQRR